MAEPTLLQQARQRLDYARALPGTADAYTRVANVGIALDYALQYLEERHAAASGSAQEPDSADEERVRLQRELAGMRGQFQSFDLDLEQTRRGKLDEPTDLDLDALQRLCDAATPGEWRMHRDGAVFAEGSEHSVCDVGEPNADMAFIATARDALPKLIAEVRRLRADLDLTDKRLRWETTKDDSERVQLERELFGGEHG